MKSKNFERLLSLWPKIATILAAILLIFGVLEYLIKFQILSFIANMLKLISSPGAYAGESIAALCLNNPFGSFIILWLLILSLSFFKLAERVGSVETKRNNQNKNSEPSLQKRNTYE